MKQLIRNESNEFEETDIIAECEDFLTNLPDKGDIDQKLTRFLSDVNRLRFIKFIPAESGPSSLGEIQIQMPVPAGVKSKPAVSRGRGRILTPRQTDQTESSKYVEKVQDVDIDNIVKRIDKVRIEKIEDYSDSHSDSSGPPLSQAAFSYCPSILDRGRFCISKKRHI